MRSGDKIDVTSIEQPRPVTIAVPTFGYDGGDPEVELFLEGFCQDLCDVLGTRDGVMAVPVFYRAASQDGEAVPDAVVRLTEAPELDLLVSVCTDLGADFGVLGSITAEVRQTPGKTGTPRRTTLPRGAPTGPPAGSARPGPAR